METRSSAPYEEKDFVERLEGCSNIDLENLKVAGGTISDGVVTPPDLSAHEAEKVIAEKCCADLKALKADDHLEPLKTIIKYLQM